MDLLLLTSECLDSDYCRSRTIAGWNEYARPYREKSLYWHRIWAEAGRPRNGVLADIMRSTRCQYHRVIRKLRKDDEYHKNSLQIRLLITTVVIFRMKLKG